MRMIATTLLTGPYDWDGTVLPRSEFAARLQRVRVALEKVGAGKRALLVHGHPADYGALAYLTNFVPKLGPALALVPREGDLVLLVPGSEVMLPQAKRLTWVEDLRPFVNVPKLVAEWLGNEAGALGTWGFASLPHRLHRAIAAAVRPWPLLPLDTRLDAVRRRKSPLELDLMREAARMLGAASDAFVESARRGDGARSAALAAERAAVAAGAQDARTLVSISPGGAPLPIDGAENPLLDPVIAAIAVQNAGYWAAGYVTAARAPSVALMHAKAGLAAALALARPGVTGASLLEAATSRLAPLSAHPVTRATIGQAVGLSLEEGAVGTLESDGTYMLATGAKGPGDGAIVSAMIAVKEGGADILWTHR